MDDSTAETFRRLADARALDLWARSAAALGNDPFDALRSPWLPDWVRRNARARQVVVQLRKRSPVDLAGVLGVAPFTMAKAAACALTARTRALRAGLGSRADVERALAGLLACDGNLGDGRWGYEFDVQTRWAFYAACSPNAIATFFASRALAETGLELDRPDVVELAAQGARFAADSLVADSPAGRFFCYTPGSGVLVHNANLLMAGLVAALGRVTGRQELLAVAQECAHTSRELLTGASDWRYGEGGSLGWCDNFHTAYDLDGLNLFVLATQDRGARALLEYGAARWQAAFFGPSGEPFYNADGSGPLDIHSAATGVDVGARLARGGLADGAIFARVAEWTAANLLDAETGRTFYQKRGSGTDRRHFVRWGDAHWALAVSSAALAASGLDPSLETALAKAGGSR